MSQTTTTQPEKYTVARLLVYLLTWKMFLGFSAFALFFMVLISFSLGMAMFLTGLGFLLLNTELESNIKNILGLGLAFVAYVVCLPGTFSPVDQVVIKNVYAVGFGANQVVVTVNARDCDYKLSGKYICDAHVIRAASSSTLTNSPAE
ncbi:hypothetical protein JC795_17780 [Pseudomonas veronii]|jgi:uncharacterized SAM-binding protein YcdF (DUF218 family)|uniref:hypothetical protein n=1 Tax=Pseudomonas TaxID=286 RepID=UPI0018E707DB|nr:MULTISPECIES: hypothetical protein [Pseudomonas]MBJ2180044.1 hypothetical protein [Pseudomonas veronii]MDB1108896.1 hypothetical protein [Pseudomonas extremaustralis]